MAGVILAIPFAAISDYIFYEQVWKKVEEKNRISKEGDSQKSERETVQKSNNHFAERNEVKSDEDENRRTPGTQGGENRKNKIEQ